ncbi:arsenic resistance N-acetyltransferase ArsN2 [Aquabacterium sp.]|uniref:arsenic resistance N-acetyltransferase ArsN2 n=1 Tax=Aquabacterium sp. TaxID=1872578 RepID=UPI002BE4FF40|nr:arsenic resistance N-acetyltransferase ArsN2 [Aquabacterium sp.]HSW08009.1 arsenic resistance N-acetyltransferase ArsN2 [Aquabacterium sp.]
MQTLNISLRPAGQNDWPAVASLLEANKLPLDGAREHLSTYLLATRNGKVIGSAGAEVYGSVALLRSVAVAPGLHRQGIGRALVSRLIEEATRRQIATLHLLSVTAPEYFAQFGFKRGPIDRAPQALKASAEFQGTCPACAAFMSLTLAKTLPARTDLPVAVIGAGPVGLAAAARLIERGIKPIVLEAGSGVGANLVDYGHVRLFSPWQYNIDHAMAAQLAPTGWLAPPAEELPLAGEVVERVLKPFAALPAVSRALRLNTRVMAISREGFDKVKTVGRESSAFVIRAMQDGQPIELRARAVIDASGTWGTPNPLGANGLPAAGERENAEAIVYGIPDVLGAGRARYAGKRTLVVGAGHSAANALLALAELAESEPGTRLAWSVRSPALARVFGGGDADALPARGQLGASLKALRDSGQLEFVSGLRISAIRRVGDTLTVEGLGPDQQPLQLHGIHQIICATGQRPDLAVTSELRLKLDPWLESTEALGPLIDPNLHSCGTVRPHGHRELSHPDQGFYTLGVKSYGRAPTFLMATGFEQARSVVAALAGDLEAADRVELDLPETGVCSAGPDDSVGESGACCGPAVSATAEVARASESAAVAVSALPTRAAGGCGSKSCGAPVAPAAAVALAAEAPVARQAVSRCCG